MVPIVVLAAISVATYVPLCPPRWSRAARLVVTPRGGSPFAAAGAEDPYEVLGVSRDATPAQIKQAYRRLALRSHPDVNKAPDAQATFARIADAYAVLSDAKNKAKYDRSSSYSSSSRGSARRSSSSSGGSSAWSGFDPTDPVGWATGKGRDPAAAAAAEERRRRWREENPTPEELGDSFGALFSDVVSAVGNAVAGSGDWLSLLDELQLSEGPEFQSMLRSRDLTMLREELESSKWVQSTLDSRIRRLTAEVQGAQEDLESFRDRFLERIIARKDESKLLRLKALQKHTREFACELREPPRQLHEQDISLKLLDDLRFVLQSRNISGRTE